MYIDRELLRSIHEYLLPNKVLIIYGPRRAGKTTLIGKYLESVSEPYLLLTGDDIFVRESFAVHSIEKLKDAIGTVGLLVIDEAQKIRDIGMALKLIVDHMPGIKVMATGSSSFELARSTGEPLTGRKHTVRLFPLSQMEIMVTENPPQTEANLEKRLIYGGYPEAVVGEDNRMRERYLKELVSSYLYKDILELDGVRHSDKIARMLRLLAFQIGRDVSFTEIGTTLGMSKNTAERYLDLLEKAFVIFRLSGFSRNSRKEIVKNGRYFFWDNGVRNALINNYNPIALRDDIGSLWENYIISERIKKQEYRGIISNNYFWRTYAKEEIDFVEEREGRLFGYEIKWSADRTKPPKGWNEMYPDAVYECVTRGNYRSFIA
ncbi:MAG: ATP-binding protein [Spirochaetes bacterium]|nr:MAG: ATP-binding protein [Spirochaetota bacterium]